MLIAVAIAVVSCFVGGAATVHAHHQGKQQKKGILIVAYGTSVPQAQVAIDNLVEAARSAYPDVEVRLAYSSGIIRNKIAQKQGLHIDSPMTALAKMKGEQFTNVAVQPTHITAGAEFHDLAAGVEAFGNTPGVPGFSRLALGAPLLLHNDDYSEMAGILKRAYGEYTDDGGAVVLMGHGTHHGGNGAYRQLQLVLESHTRRFVVGTVKGFPGMAEVKERLHHIGAELVTLVPFMVVAGDHAMNDMACRENPQSWLNTLNAAGYRTTAIVKGLGELEEVPHLMLKHLHEAALRAFE
ncbi:MAG: sirohydrochlorin cobaltochelatase [Synergistales bacterium]|nr:sirohydrochlorin cobaltochelatase [Synergistales bacterium]